MAAERSPAAISCLPSLRRRVERDSLEHPADTSSTRASTGAIAAAGQGRTSGRCAQLRMVSTGNLPGSCFSSAICLPVLLRILGGQREAEFFGLSAIRRLWARRAVENALFFHRVDPMVPKVH